MSERFSSHARNVERPMLPEKCRSKTNAASARHERATGGIAYRDETKLCRRERDVGWAAARVYPRAVCAGDRGICLADGARAARDGPNCGRAVHLQGQLRQG